MLTLIKLKSVDDSQASIMKYRMIKVSWKISENFLSVLCYIIFLCIHNLLKLQTKSKLDVSISFIEYICNKLHLFLNFDTRFLRTFN